MSGERYKLEDAKSERLRTISLINVMIDWLCDHGRTNGSGAIQVLLDDAGGYQTICVNEFPSSVGTRPSKMIENACIA